MLIHKFNSHKRLVGHGLNILNLLEKSDESIDESSESSNSRSEIVLDQTLDEFNPEHFVPPNPIDDARYAHDIFYKL